MKINHIECEIICDDVTLVEYQEKSDSAEGDKKAKSCYIVSEAGKRFSCRVKSDPHRFDATFRLFIDGQCLDDIGIRYATPCDMKGARVGQSQLRPFVFSYITTTDDDRILKESLSKAKDLGTICLQINRFKNAKDIDVPQSTFTQQLDSDKQPVHEKTKKAGAHRVALGAVEAANFGKRITVDYIDPLDSPYYTFIWRYRPKAILQAQGIIPQDAPSPSSNKRAGSTGPSGGSSKRPRLGEADSDEGSSSQVKVEDTEASRALQARRDALRAQRAALEAQEAALEEELRQANVDGIKREASPIVLGAGDGVVIDLTEDD